MYVSRSQISIFEFEEFVEFLKFQNVHNPCIRYLSLEIREESSTKHEATGVKLISKIYIRTRLSLRVFAYPYMCSLFDRIFFNEESCEHNYHLHYAQHLTNMHYQVASTPSLSPRFANTHKQFKNGRLFLTL